jgi:hypothetical protein
MCHVPSRYRLRLPGSQPRCLATCARLSLKAALFGFHALGKGLGLGCRIIPKEGDHGPELSRNGLGLATLPVGHRFNGYAYLSAGLPLEERQLLPALLEVLA